MTDNTIPLTIQGIAFRATAPFKAGHVLSAAEASVLNQCRCDNLRNNFAKFVKSYKIDGPDSIEALRAKFAEYDAKYSFSLPTVVDPVELEARRIATALVQEELSRRSTDPHSVSKERMQKFVAEAAALPSVLEEAKRRAEAKRHAAAETSTVISNIISLA